MIRVGNFWVCGRHSEPRTLPVERPPPERVPIVEVLPTPLALPVAEYLGESNPFIALHRLTDAAELITRFFAIVLLSDVRQRFVDFPSSLKRELTEKFVRPSFGAWRDFVTAALRALQEETHPCFLAELPHYWRELWESWIGKNDGDPESEILPLRNLLAHSGRLSDRAAADLLDHHRVYFEEKLDRLSFLTTYHLIATLGEGGTPLSLRGLPIGDEWSLPRLDRSDIPQIETLGERLKPREVYLLKDQEPLGLFPLHAYGLVMLWREEEQIFRAVDKPSPMLYLRYNDRRQIPEFTALAPRSYFAQQSEEFREAFLSIYKLSDWRREKREAEVRSSEWQRFGYDFHDLIEELAEGLVGRTEPQGTPEAPLPSQMDQATGWVRSHLETGGILWISGKPGVGKSAFTAELAKQLKADARLCVVPFFFRGGDERCSPDHFFRAARLRLSETFTLPPPVDPRESRQVQFIQALDAVRQKESREHQAPTMLFLLDGLDEVAGQHLDFVRLPLSLKHPRLIWICAGRHEPPLTEIFITEGVEQLWENAEMPPLAERDVRALVAQECDRLRYELFKRDEPSANSGHRNPFIETLVERSEGLPLYIRLVIEDLAAGRLTFLDENKLPAKLQDYFERILERLKVGDIPQMLTDLLALLCWTYEPLTEAITRDVLRPLYAAAADWERVLAGAFRYGHVMLRRGNTLEGVSSWSLYHESFRQHLHTTSTFRIARERANQLLLDWCSRWKEHRQAYALRHYAAHLCLAQRYDALCSLARDEAFFQVQAETLVDEPDAPLLTIQKALEMAMARDDAATTTEFALAHARRLTQIESPLDALRAGRLQRAWRIADLQGSERSTLWYLLLAWELEATGNRQEAANAMERLKDKELPRLKYWQAEYATKFLLEIVEANENAFRALEKKLLTDNARKELCLRLAARERSLVAALAVAEDIRDEFLRALALVAVGKAQALSGARVPARETFEAASASARKIQWPYHRAETQAKIGATREEVREEGISTFDEAVESAKSNQRPAEALLMVAQVLTNSGRADMAQKTLREAADAARAAAPYAGRNHALLWISQAQAHLGDYRGAIQSDEAILGDSLRGGGLAAVSDALAKSGEVSAAHEMARTIEDPFWRAKALGHIAEAQARSGAHAPSAETFSGAVKCALECEKAGDRSIALWRISEGQTRSGYFHEALDTAQIIENSDKRFEAFIALADAQVTVGAGQWLQATMTRATQTAYEAESYKVPKLLAAIAEVEAKAGQTEKARATFVAALERAQELDSSESLISIAQAQDRAGFRPLADRVFSSALDSARARDDSSRRAELLSSIAKSFASRGDTTMAVETAREARSTSFRDWRRSEVREPAPPWAATAEALEAAEDLAGARWVYAAGLENPVVSIPETVHVSRALGAIGEAQLRAAKHDEAARTFSYALDTVRCVEQPSWLAEALRTVVESLSSAEDLSMLRSTLSECLIIARGISRKYARSEVMLAIAKTQAAAGDFAAALATRSMLDDREHERHLLACLAAAQARAGRFAEADRMQRWIPYEGQRESHLIAIAKAQAEAGAFSAAIETARSMYPRWNPTRALVAIAAEQARTGRAEEARATFAEAVRSARRLNLGTVTELAAIATEQSRAGDRESAHATLRIALEKVKKLDKETDRAVGLVEIAEAQAVAEEGEAARKTLTAAEEEAQRCGDDEGRTFSLRWIATGLARVGAFRAATEMAHKDENIPWRDEVLTEVARCEALRGQGDDAVETAMAILTNRSEFVYQVASTLVDVWDKRNFKALLTPCAYYLDAAYRLCGLLAKLYPDQMLAIAHVVFSASQGRKICQGQQSAEV